MIWRDRHHKAWDTVTIPKNVQLILNPNLPPVIGAGSQGTFYDRVDQDKEKTFFSEFRAEDLQDVIDTQEAVIAYMRKNKQKAAWPNILLVFDDLADSPEFMRREKLLRRLFIRGRWASFPL